MGFSVGRPAGRLFGNAWCQRSQEFACVVFDPALSLPPALNQTTTVVVKKQQQLSTSMM